MFYKTIRKMNFIKLNASIMYKFDVYEEKYSIFMIIRRKKNNVYVVLMYL